MHTHIKEGIDLLAGSSLKTSVWKPQIVAEAESIDFVRPCFQTSKNKYKEN